MSAETPAVRIGVSTATLNQKIRVQRDGPAVSIGINSGGVSYPIYQGPHTVTPGPEAQVLETRNTEVIENIIVEPIPQNYGLITYNGRIITVS